MMIRWYKFKLSIQCHLGISCYHVSIVISAFADITAIFTARDEDKFTMNWLCVEARVMFFLGGIFRISNFFDDSFIYYYYYYYYYYYHHHYYYYYHYYFTVCSTEYFLFWFLYS